MPRSAREVSVLYLINSLGAGGAERSLVELVGPLRERGIEIVTTVLEEPAEGFAQEAAALGDVHHLAGGTMVARARAMRALVTRSRPNIIHTTLFEADMLGRILRPTIDVPLVCSLVNTTYDRNRLRFDPTLQPAKVRAVQAIDLLTSPIVDHYHAISAAVAASAHRHLRIRRRRMSVVPRGRDDRRLGEASVVRRSRVRASLGLGDERVLLAVGRLEPQKGHRFLIDALPAVLEADPSTVLLVAGRTGTAGAALRDQIRHRSLEADVRVLGFREDVPDLVAAADAFVFPSVYEGLGGSLLEAMALGTPIVASDIPALREAASAGGAVFVPVGDSAALARAILEVTNDPVAAGERAVVARQRFLDTYTLDAAADGMAEMYRRVAARGRRA